MTSLFSLSFKQSDLTPDTICVAVARVGASDQKIAAATLSEMSELDMGSPLHSLVIPGHMHPLEAQMLKLFAASDHAKDLLETIEKR